MCLIGSVYYEALIVIVSDIFNEEISTVDEFLGVPYATPPTGILRFRVSFSIVMNIGYNLPPFVL